MSCKNGVTITCFFAACSQCAAVRGVFVVASAFPVVESMCRHIRRFIVASQAKTVRYRTQTPLFFLKELDYYSNRYFLF